jgi:plasmid stabilization system protein ParE
MRFTVIWHPTAEAELAEIWLHANDQASVTQAANHIDQALAVHPFSQGEEFYGDRILVVLPLAVTYTVSEPDLTVQILQVWHQSQTSENAN